jgi:kynurenine 3-monooxygenase
MKVIIVGSGPSGLFLAHKLLSRSQRYQVEIFEKLDDPNISQDNDKEFGFGLWEKAQTWLKSIDGLWELVAQEAISLNAGNLILIPRRRLCAILINLLKERFGNNLEIKVAQCSIHFKTSVIGVSLESREVFVETAFGQQKIGYDLLVAADGVRSTIRDAAIASNPEKYAFEQKLRPHLWKVLELPEQPDWEQTQPRLIRLQKRKLRSISAFGAYIPRHDRGWSALIFWQPTGENDKINPCGVETLEQLQQLLHQMQSRSLPIPKLDPDKANAFLTKRPSFEYWSRLSCYHHQEGCLVAIGDAAHAMFSLFAQGCTVALADAIALDALLKKYNDDLKLVLPEFSNNRVVEGQAASDLSSIALVFYHPLFQLLYGFVTKFSMDWLKRPSIFVQINQINISYLEVLRENKFWVWLGKRLLKNKVL